MRYTYVNRLPGRPQSLLARLATAVVAAVILVAAFFLGLFFVAGFVALFVVVALVFGIRIWWFRRRMEKMGQSNPAQSDFAATQRNDGTETGRNGSVIEGEYHHIDR